jgi:predicted MarR family transcription regulator
MEGAPDRYMSSSELATLLTRMEVAMVRTIQGFGRWTAALNRSVSGVPLHPEEVWLLHAIRMRGGSQNLSELLLFLNRNDVSTIQYSLKKLEQFELVERVTGHSKREAGYRLTEKGVAATSDYARLREDMLIGLLKRIRIEVEAIENTAAALEHMTGVYDQSTQLALNRTVMGL